MSSAASIDDLTTPLTTDEVKTSIYNVLAALGVSTTNWKPGAVVRTIIAAVAIIIAAASQLTAKVARSGFLDTAEGNWLTLLAFYVYGVTRIPATSATGDVLLTNAGGGIYVFGVGDLQLRSSVSGKTYTNTSAGTLGASSTLTLSFQADEVGEDSTAFVGEIDTLVAPLTGVTCANAAVLVGTDEESDPALRSRCRARLGALSPNGPADAYDYIAKSATRVDGTNIGITQTRTVPDGVGGLDCYVVNAGGAVTGTVGDTSTDLGAVDDELQRKCVPLGITLRTQSGTALAFPVTYEIWLYNTLGLSESQIEDYVQDALEEWFENRPLGGDYPSGPPGSLFKSGIEAAIGAARTPAGVSLNIFRVSITAPASDTVLAASQKATLGAVTATAIHQVSP